MKSVGMCLALGLMGFLSPGLAMEDQEVWPRPLSVRSEAGLALAQILEELQAQYDHQLDNNWIAVKMLDTPDFDKVVRGYSRTQIEGQEEHYFAISECLLLWRGAYGVHLTPNERHRIASEFAPRLDAWARAFALPFGAAEIIYYDPQERQPVMADWDIINSRCTLAIELGEGVTVLADSHSVD